MSGTVTGGDGGSAVDLGRLLDALGEAVIATDPVGTIIYWNRAAERLYGWSAEEVMGHPVAELMSAPEAVEQAQQIMTELVAGRSWSGEFPVRRRDGTRLSALVTDTPVFDDTGRLTAIIGIAIDLTAYRRADRALQRSEERFRRLFEDNPLPIAMVDAAGRTLAANDAFCDMFGYSPADIPAVSVTEIVPVEEATEASELVGRLFAGELHRYRTEGRRLRRDGTELWVSVTGTGVRDEGGLPLYVMLMYEDVTARRQAEMRLAHLALHDGLTGLPNRVLLLDRLHHAQETAERAGGHVGVLFVDIDGLKAVNDSLGHPAGDQLLVQVARCIEGVLRPGDTAARLGGDEFVVCCEDIGSSPEQARRRLSVVARRIVTAVGTPVELRGRRWVVGASVGSALSAGTKVPVEELIRLADASMYRAKARKGHGRAALRLYEYDESGDPSAAVTAQAPSTSA